MSAAAGVAVKQVPTTKIDGQKTGTSGLRKKAKEFSSGNYLANWVQSLFNALPAEQKARRVSSRLSATELAGCASRARRTPLSTGTSRGVSPSRARASVQVGATLVLGGDGRWFNKEAAQIIIKLAAGNGVAKLLVGRDGFLCTPAASAVIRARKAAGGFIMSASHNPGGPDADWGIKYNSSAGEPAPEKLTDAIYGFTQSVSTLNVADIPDVDLTKVGSSRFGSFEVEIIDPVADYLALFRDQVFDFPMLRAFVSRSDFRMRFDALHAITGAYAKPILCDALGAPASSVVNDTPLEDFGGGHPDPNLTYAHDLVEFMYGPNGADFGAASDGDGDRNMILGKKFFVTPSDSVAIIAAYGQRCIPWLKGGVKGLARSMPTAAALDRVAKKMGVPFFETPTGWKFFGNLMDAGKCSVCGEESFGTGSDHVREKDGLWAVLAWLSILAYRNKDVPVGGKLVSVEQIAAEHWAEYGRNFFSRYDYEECSSADAGKMVDHIRGIVASAKPGDKFGAYTLALADDFAYTDPIDGSVATKQGLRFVFTDGSRIIFRLSGTGSSGATIRLYVEQYESDVSKQGVDAQQALAPLIKVALDLSKLQEFTGRDKPTVIT